MAELPCLSPNVSSTYLRWRCLALDRWICGFETGCTQILLRLLHRRAVRSQGKYMCLTSSQLFRWQSSPVPWHRLARAAQRSILGWHDGYSLFSVLLVCLVVIGVRSYLGTDGPLWFCDRCLKLYFGHNTPEGLGGYCWSIFVVAWAVSVTGSAWSVFNEDGRDARRKVSLLAVFPTWVEFRWVDRGGKDYCLWLLLDVWWFNFQMLSKLENQYERTKCL